MDRPLRIVAASLGLLPPLHVAVGGLGPRGDVDLMLFELEECEDLREAFAASNPDCNEFLLPAYEINDDGLWYVRGRSTP